MLGYRLTSACLRLTADSLLLTELTYIRIRQASFLLELEFRIKIEELVEQLMLQGCVK